MIYFLLGWPLSGILTAFVCEYIFNKKCPTWCNLAWSIIFGYIFFGGILMVIFGKCISKITSADFWDKRPCGRDK